MRQAAASGGGRGGILRVSSGKVTRRLFYRLLLGPGSYSTLAGTEGLVEGLAVAVQAGSRPLKSCALFVLSQLALLGNCVCVAREMRSSLAKKFELIELPCSRRLGFQGVRRLCSWGGGKDRETDHHGP